VNMFECACALLCDSIYEFMDVTKPTASRLAIHIWTLIAALKGLSHEMDLAFEDMHSQF
jgi:hypothetical protein